VTDVSLSLLINQFYICIFVILFIFILYLYSAFLPTSWIAVSLVYAIILEIDCLCI